MDAILDLFNQICHHSLVTPIDWKRQGNGLGSGQGSGHHSLVTPIDWKL